jgi:hypothetical protein
VTRLPPYLRHLRLLALVPAFLLAGCANLHPGAQKQYVYVVTKRTYLRDRVAVIAAHVEDISNGERLEIVQRDGRFFRVKAPDGKVGWLEEHSVIDQAEFDRFAAQARDHADDPVVATATLLNESNLHLGPGRKVEHFYILPANDKLQLLERASVPKPLPPQALLTPHSLKPRLRARAGTAPRSMLKRRPTRIGSLPLICRLTSRGWRSRWKTGGWCATSRARWAGCSTAAST